LEKLLHQGDCLVVGSINERVENTCAKIPFRVSGKTPHPSVQSIMRKPIPNAGIYQMPATPEHLLDKNLSI
jgi:hypothetical protein